MGKLQPEQNHKSKTTQPENSRSTTSASFVQNVAMNTEQKLMTMTDASCSQNAVLKEEPADESRSMTGSKLSEEWREVDTGHYEIILDFEPAPKPKVVLPPITNGAANASAFQKLQDRLEQADAEANILKEGATQHENALQLRPDAQVQENLRSDVNTKLNELRDALQKQILSGLSADQAADLLEHPVISAKLDEKITAARAEERGKLEAQFQARVDKAKMELSEHEIQDLLNSNWFAQSIMASRLHKRLEEEKTKMEVQIQERIEAAKTQLSEDEIRQILTSNSAAISIFKGNLNKRLEIEKARITTTLKAEFEEKSSAVEVAANTKRPSAFIAKAQTPTVSPALPASGFPAPPNEQISFGAGISRLTTPFGYPIAPLSTSPSSTPSVIFGQTWKPRTPLGFLSSSPIANLQSDNNARVKTETPFFGKRTRDTEDVGESEAGTKKSCSEN